MDPYGGRVWWYGTGTVRYQPWHQRALLGTYIVLEQDSHGVVKACSI